MVFLKPTMAMVCALAALPLLAGEPEAKGAAPEQRPATLTLESVMNSIPNGPLDEGVLLQAGDMKVQMSAVSKVEDAYLAAIKRDRPQMTVGPEQQVGLRKNVAFRLLLNAVLEKYVVDNKIEVDKTKFDTEFAKLKQEQESKGRKYEQFLADNGLTDEDFRKAWQSSWALEQKMSQTVPEDEVKKVLDGQAESMPLRRASHVLFMYKGSERAPAEVTRSKEEAKAAAEDVVKKLKAGEDFAKLAAAQSDCPSKAQGGDLDFFPRKGGMVEPFAAATYKFEKVGDYTTEPVETPFGYHVIKLTELKSTDDMKAQIRLRLAGQKLNTQVTELVAAASKGAKFNEKLIAPEKPVAPAVPATPEKK